MGKKSPLKHLVDAAGGNLPVKVTPTRKNGVLPVEIVDNVDLEISNPPIGGNLDISHSGLEINNSSLTINFNVNLDRETVGRAAKGLAAGMAAMFGTAFIAAGFEKRVGKIKVPKMPEVKIPKS